MAYKTQKQLLLEIKDLKKEIEKEIQFLRDDITQIRIDNHEILRIVGRLEGKVDSH